jgi:hypothetical protein
MALPESAAWAMASAVLPNFPSSRSQLLVWLLVLVSAWLIAQEQALDFPEFPESARAIDAAKLKAARQ